MPPQWRTIVFWTSLSDVSGGSLTGKRAHFGTDLRLDYTLTPRQQNQVFHAVHRARAHFPARQPKRKRTFPFGSPTALCYSAARPYRARACPAQSRNEPAVSSHLTHSCHFEGAVLKNLPVAVRSRQLSVWQAILVNAALLSLQASCQLFAVFHLPSAPDLPSIQIESRPARIGDGGNRFLNQC